ncbi:MAG: indolepyruvate ferredoxin oxidoreductase subunit alpha [Candidatus Coatesbacteria bacterium]|nr:indolepyruvate ferredoxin oxidoreductase subunit alpha [Candidatus Coatesbacteria bacterium]
MRKFLSGNEAVARGAYEYGVQVAAAYPGTPSTEILENVAAYEEIYSQWSVNEKTSLEIALGASFGGARSLVAMKHVGLNVAADPFFSAAYIGCDGGLVVVSADDPGMHSSQNEQDNRNYARHAKVPMFEPADSQEAKDMVGTALEIAEKYQTLSLIRLTTRICHSKSLVDCGERKVKDIPPYQKEDTRRVILPARARKRRARLDEVFAELERESNDSPWNYVIEGGGEIGVIASGIGFQYVREVLPTADFLKLGFTNPLPWRMIEDFCASYDVVYVVEENDPIVETQLKARGFNVVGKELIPGVGELNQQRVAEGLAGGGLPVAKKFETPIDTSGLPLRAPVLCPGCPHRGVYDTLRRLKYTVTGDIGCYTLGALPPLSAMDTCVDMGAAVTVAFGLELAQGKEFAKKTVATIGESTFLHSGMTGLMDLIYNRGNTTVCILDNRITAMTGHQFNPASGYTLDGKEADRVDFEKLVHGMGVEWTRTVDPLDLEATKQALKEATDHEGPAVLVFKSPCALTPWAKELPRVEYYVDEENCVKCRACINLGCTGISPSGTDGKARFDPTLCVGCGLCEQVCKFGAVTRVTEETKKESWCVDPE